MSSPQSEPESVPPSLPAGAPHQRFQFHLKHLLAFMLASAFLAAGARLVLGWLKQLPEGYLTSWTNVLLGGLALGGLAWFFLRVPFLVVGIGRASSRWSQVRAHRRELAKWADTRRSEGRRIMHEEGEPEA